MRSDFDWQLREGRDHDGDKFKHWVLVHGSGRILAKVYCPISGDDYNCEAAFFATVVGREKDLRDERDMRFMDVESAKQFTEEALADFSAEAEKAGSGKAAGAMKVSVDCSI